VTSVTVEFMFASSTYDLPITINSMLGGLVAVTASCVYIDNWSAILLGFLSAVVTRYGSLLLTR
jgi:Amt family ammonium transporter